MNAVRDFPGFRTALGDALEEARRAGVEPDTLEAVLRNGAPLARHHAFQQLFLAYLTALRQTGANEAQHLSQVFETLASGGLRLRLLLFDGFADFTAEQRALLMALLPHAPVAVVTLTLDPQKRDLFYQAERSRAWLESLGFRELWIDGNHRPRAESLAAVELGLREGKLRPRRRCGRRKARFRSGQLQTAGMRPSSSGARFCAWDAAASDTAKSALLPGAPANTYPWYAACSVAWGFRCGPLFLPLRPTRLPGATYDFAWICFSPAAARNRYFIG